MLDDDTFKGNFYLSATINQMILKGLMLYIKPSPVKIIILYILQNQLKNMKILWTLL